MKGDLLNKFLENQEKIEKEKSVKQQESKEEITLIDVDLLDEFENHIFSAITKNKFEELKESISRAGVLSPIIVRKKDSNRYEIISGHNRCRCCKELEIKNIPAIIKDYDNDMAKLIMIETNLAQRENILPCEKGLAYKIRYELIKKMNNKNNANDSNTNGLEEKVPMGHQEKSIEKLANESDDSVTQIKRFIRLTELNDSLKQKVNDEIIGVRAGVQLSYIKPEEQNIVNDVIDEYNIKLTIAQAERLREVYGTITRENVLDIIKGTDKKKKQDKFTGKINKKLYKKYKDKFANDNDFCELIELLLENYYKSQSDK